jgi:hypothetical protein
MKMPRLSIAQMMVIVGVIALNATIIRVALEFDEEGNVLGLFAPMALLCQASLFGLICSRGRRRFFWAGVLLFGSLATIEFIWDVTTYQKDSLWLKYGDFAVRSLRAMTDSVWIVGSGPDPHGHDGVPVWTRMIILATPQLAIAVAGGLLCCSPIASKERRPPTESGGQSASETQVGDAPSPTKWSP